MEVCWVSFVWLENENKELLAQAEGLRKILSDRLELDRVLIGELEVIKQQHGDARRTDITNVVINADEKDIQFVQPEDVVVVVSKSGSLKKIPAKSYKVQNRNGVGVKNQLIKKVMFYNFMLMKTNRTRHRNTLPFQSRTICSQWQGIGDITYTFC